MIQIQNREMILDLFNIGAIQFGDFILKSGISSPVYIDLRRIISFPILVKEIRNALWQLISPIKYHLICGVPYTALPLATALSLEYNMPMLMRRKETKKHGTRTSIEGIFNQGQTCLVIEDVITTGASILETVTSLRKAKITVKDICIVLNREQSGVKTIQEHGLVAHSLLNIYQILDVLYEEKKISKELFMRTTHFLRGL